MFEFKIGSSLLKFTETQDAYRVIRNKYKNIAKVIGEDIAERYVALFANPEQFMVSLERIAAEYINRITNTAICDLITYGVIDVDDSAFLAHYSEHHLTWTSDISMIREIYNSIVLDGEPVPQNSSGGGVIGGGFGVEGAAKGIAIATAANAAIGVATGMINAASAGLKSLEMKNRLATLINLQESKIAICSAVENLVFNAHRSLVDLVKERRPDTSIEFVSSRQEAQSSAIVWNVQKGRVPHENIENALFQAIRLNPYLEASYRQWQLSNCPTDGGFDALLEHLSIDLNDNSPTAKQACELSATAGIYELQKGFIEILAAFKSDDFYVCNSIPERKKKNAIDNYYNCSIFSASAGDLASSSNIAEIGDMLALVDATAFGSAEHGLAIGTVGFGWKDSSTSGAITWEEFTAKGIVVDTGFLKITIGDKSFANTSAIKNNLLASLINELAGYYKSSKIKI